MFLQFRIWLARLIFGKYSIQYLEFFRERGLNPDIRPCLKDHFMPHFFPFYKRVNEAPLLKTREKIRFLDTDFGCLYKLSPFKRRKIENFSAYRTQNHVLTIYGYAGHSFGAHHREVAYFLDSRLVLGEITFSLSKTKKPDIPKIYAELAQIYGITPPDTSKGFYIEDPYDSLLYCYNNGFELVLSYFSPKVEGILEAMENWFKEPKQPQTTGDKKVKL
ncbi:MAG: hypothetical protein ACP5O2_06400 [Bacteroidales bacterium]